MTGYAPRFHLLSEGELKQLKITIASNIRAGVYRRNDLVRARRDLVEINRLLEKS